MRLNRRYRDEAALARPGHLDRGTDQAADAALRRGTWCWCSSTGSTWPCCGRCATPAACARPRSAPCTSCSTARRPSALQRDVDRARPRRPGAAGDRRVPRPSAGRAPRPSSRCDTVIQDRAEVTVLLPRRTFQRLSQRLLHDRTADRIAEAVGRIPHVAATIVPFDTTLAPRRSRSGWRRRAANAAAPRAGPAPSRPARRT